MRSYLVALLVLSGFLYPYGFIRGETYKGDVILAGQEITRKIRAGSSEVFYGGIYVGCSSVRYDDADIIVSVTEPGKPEMRRKMRAGDSMNISYKNKDYRLILRNINFFEQDIVVAVIRTKD